MVTSEILVAKFGTIFPHLDERQRRLLMGPRPVRWGMAGSGSWPGPRVSGRPRCRWAPMSWTRAPDRARQPVADASGLPSWIPGSGRLLSCRPGRVLLGERSIVIVPGHVSVGERVCFRRCLSVSVHVSEAPLVRLSVSDLGTAHVQGPDADHIGTAEHTPVFRTRVFGTGNFGTCISGPHPRGEQASSASARASG